MINVVMVAKDRERLTMQSIDSLYSHTDRTKFNFTLVDDGSAKPWGVREHASCLRVSNSNHILGKLKNLGVYWSEHHFGRGEWLYLSDNDVYFMEGWSEALIGNLIWCENAYKFALLGGQNHPYHQPCGEDHIYPYKGPVFHKVKEYHALAGTSWLMRWETWDKYGPLPETGAPGVGQSEDHEFCQRIRRDGFKVGAVWPHVVLHTGITQTDGKLSPGNAAMHKVQGVYYQ